MRKNRRKGTPPSLSRIIFVLCALAVAAYGTYVGARWLTRPGVSVADASVHETLKGARDLLDKKDFEQARIALEPLVQSVKDPEVRPEAMALLAAANYGLGKQQDALDLLKSVSEDYSSHPEHARFTAQYARLLEERKELARAAEVYETVRRSAPPELRAPAVTGLGRIKETEGDLVAARDYYRSAVGDAKWSGPEWNEAVDGLGRVNVALIFSTADTGSSKTYLVQSGDNLISIGVKLNTTLGLLTRANGIEPDTTLRLNQALKYTPKDFRVVIERSTCRLFLFDNDGLFKRYYVGLGMPGHETTLGKYKVGNKQKDPTWFKPGAGPIAAGDPANELGTRWMPLVPQEEGLPSDLGIHGTIAPETIGSYSSHGCARMRKEDVEELYDLIVRSTPVEIVEVYAPPQEAEKLAQTEERMPAVR